MIFGVAEFRSCELDCLILRRSAEITCYLSGVKPKPCDAAFLH